MSESTTLNYNSPAAQSTPRWGIGLMIILAMWLVIKIPEWTVPTTMFRFSAMVWGPIVGTLAIMIWWLGFSRLPWRTCHWHSHGHPSPSHLNHWHWPGCPSLLPGCHWRRHWCPPP